MTLFTVFKAANQAAADAIAKETGQTVEVTLTPRADIDMTISGRPESVRLAAQWVAESLGNRSMEFNEPTVGDPDWACAYIYASDVYWHGELEGFVRDIGKDGCFRIRDAS